MSNKPYILLIEPFYGDSHRQLIDYLTGQVLPAGSWHLVAMTAKKWHWRARCSALHVSQQVAEAAKDGQFSHLLCSSVLNLAELIGLCPGLAACRKLIYFHENQLVYPVRKMRGERDFQYGYNQILSALAADLVLFNSQHNRDSFVSGVDSFLNAMPDYRTRGLGSKIAAKSQILHLPVDVPVIDADWGLFEAKKIRFDAESRADVGCNDAQLQGTSILHPKLVEPGLQQHQLRDSQLQDTQLRDSQLQDTQLRDSQLQDTQLRDSQLQDTQLRDSQLQNADLQVSEDSHLADNHQLRKAPVQATFRLAESITQRNPLLILWPHRWEHDKNADSFFNSIFALVDSGETNFALCVLGQSFAGPLPTPFESARRRLPAELIAHWGYLDSRQAYFACLSACHVVVSTAQHEFFGLAMLEATAAGCYPLAPRRLAYPELLPDECLYNTDAQLVKRLRLLCRGGPQLVRRLRAQGDFQTRLDRLRPEALHNSYAKLFA